MLPILVHNGCKSCISHPQAQTCSGTPRKRGFDDTGAASGFCAVGRISWLVHSKSNEIIYECFVCFQWGAIRNYLAFCRSATRLTMPESANISEFGFAGLVFAASLDRSQTVYTDQVRLLSTVVATSWSYQNQVLFLSSQMLPTMLRRLTIKLWLATRTPLASRRLGRHWQIQFLQVTFIFLSVRSLTIQNGISHFLGIF